MLANMQHKRAHVQLTAPPRSGECVKVESCCCKKWRLRCAIFSCSLLYFMSSCTVTGCYCSHIRHTNTLCMRERLWGELLGNSTKPVPELVHIYRSIATYLCVWRHASVIIVAMCVWVVWIQNINTWKGQSKES